MKRRMVLKRRIIERERKRRMLTRLFMLAWETSAYDSAKKCIDREKEYLKKLSESESLPCWMHNED